MCQIVVDDPQASRRHAQLIVRAGSASVNDLGSVNGVFVDGVRIGTQPEPLLPGCRIVIGNELLQVDAGFPPRSRAAADTLSGEERTPPLREDHDEPTVRTLSSMLPPPPDDTGRTTPGVVPTQRVDAVEIFASIAMEAIRGGRAADAEQLLGVHLRALLAAAKGGRNPRPETVVRAVDLALELALTGRAGWSDFIVELLDTLRLPPGSREVMERLERAVRVGGSIDVGKLIRWARTLRHRIATLEVQDLDSLDRIERIIANSVRSR